MQAQTYSILYAFQRKVDGGGPQAGLFLSPGGGLYGTTFLGGDPSCSCGTVFELLPNGAFTVLHEFTGPDGANPAAALIADGDGNLYGTTSQGGSGRPNDGTVFKLAPPVKEGAAWTETVLHTFKGGADGANPYARLIRDRAGNFYGTTLAGGTFHNGTVFKLDATGKESPLYSFAGAPDGAHPYAGLVQDGEGNLYGTTLLGGAFNSGTVFQLDATGKERVLYSFSGQADGAYPNADLILDGAGDAYGTTNEGGDVAHHGTVFKLDNTGTLTVLYTFAGGNDGASPDAGLILDESGNLYGTTTQGGNKDNNGTVFKLDKTGRLTLLHTFTAGLGGAYPYASLVRDPAGNLYGTVVDVGPSGNGVVFKIALAK
ncbi:MAG: choice-of-anchor tandem repeat GloVer-containing protein [Terriglobales bacterium]